MNTENTCWQIPFFTIWTGQAISLLGSMVGRFALVWWLTELTGSATVLTTATLAAVIPQVFIAPLAGAYVDRWNRRVVMMVADSFIALISLVLAYLFWTDQMQVWHVYVVVLLRAMGSTFHGPAMSASTSLMVPEKYLSRAAGMNQTLNGALMMAGPPLGALALNLMPLHYVMLLDVATALPAILPLFFTHIPQPQRATEREEPSIWVDVRDGIRYLLSWRGLFMLIAMSAVLNLFYNPIISLLPLYVTRHFGGEAAHLGWLQSAQGIGIVLGGLLLSIWGGFKRRIHTALAGEILQGAATIVFGLLSPDAFEIALIMWGLAFFFNVFFNGPMFAFLQAVVRPEMQGRVFTAQMSMVWIAWPLGLVIAGQLVDRSSVQTWIIAGGVVEVTLGTVALLIPAIVNLEEEGKARATMNTEKPKPLTSEDSSSPGELED